MTNKILIVGGGYVGFYVARSLEKQLKQAEIILVDPLPYMTYQPFLPEVAAGSIEPRHTVVGHRRHLRRTRIINAHVTKLDHERRRATITPEQGEAWEQEYDQVVIAAGAVSRTFPIPGVADNAIGIKNIEEAVAIRDTLLNNYEKAASLPPGPLRNRLLTVTVVGGGFAGIETIAELRSLATAFIKRNSGINLTDTKFYLIEAMGRIMPEVSLESSKWVIDNLTKRGVDIRLETQLQSCENGVVQLSTGESYESDLIIWTAGVMANPGVAKGSGLPLDERGRITVLPDLRVCNGEEPVPGAWAAGDIAAVPDLSGGGVGGFCVPNAQHAVRQAKRLANNICLLEQGAQPQNYLHKTKGAVAGLGLGVGVLQSGNFALKGFLGWLVHRAYHGLAMPMVERKFRIITNWIVNSLSRRDTVGLKRLDDPKGGFRQWASRPK